MHAVHAPRRLPITSAAAATAPTASRARTQHVGNTQPEPPQRINRRLLPAEQRPQQPQPQQQLRHDSSDGGRCHQQQQHHQRYLDDRPVWKQMEQQMQRSRHTTVLPPLQRRRSRRRRRPPAVQSPTTAWTLHHARLLALLRRRQLMPQGARVLVAVSGGQDSMALLRLLHDLSRLGHWPLELVVAHCDHRVRPDASASAAHVRRHAAVLGLPFLQTTAARETGHWPEAAARAWRHGELRRMACESGCGFIALGHTATDRAETALLNLARGAGPGGLAAMGWARSLGSAHQGQQQQQQQGAQQASDQPALCLVRPLLGMLRSDTLEVCRQTDTQVYEDATNADQRYSRNRVRLSVLPLLDAVNPRAVQHIAATLELLRHTDELLASLAQQAAAAGAVTACRLQPALGAGLGSRDQQQELSALDAGALRSLPVAVQHALVRQWLQQQQHEHGEAHSCVTMFMVRQVLQLLEQGNARRGGGRGSARSSTLWGGSSVVLHAGRLLLLLDQQQLQDLRARRLCVVDQLAPVAAA